MALTGRAALLALLGVLPVAVLDTAASVWVLLGLLTIGVGVDVLLTPLGALALSRDGDTRCRLGEPAQVQLAVANRGTRRVRAVLRDAWGPSAAAAPRTQPLDLPPGERRLLTTTLLPTRRGDRHADRVTVRTVGPLGLAGRQRSFAVPWAVRVQPSFASRSFLPEKLDRLRQLDGALLARTRGQGSEFDSLREYVHGDDVRSIDWRATARRADLMVRTWRPERDRRLLLVLDTGRTSAGRIGDVPRLDAALDATLLLTALASRAGDRVDLLAIDRAVRAAVMGAGPQEVLSRITDATALLEPALVETSGATVVREVLRRSRRRSLVVLFTALDAAALKEGLLPHLASLTMRHTVLLASVSDPRWAELSAGRAGAAEVYAAAAAHRALAERAAVKEQLRRLGVEVVDAPPARFAPAVADAYLALKGAGRL